MDSTVSHFTRGPRVVALASRRRFCLRWRRTNRQRDAGATKGTRFADNSGEDFLEDSPSRVLRDGEGTFRVTVIEASGILEMSAHVKYFGAFERTGE